MNGYCEKHERPYQWFCICGDWRYECVQCRAEGLYDTIVANHSEIKPKSEWTVSNTTLQEE